MFSISGDLAVTALTTTLVILGGLLIATATFAVMAPRQFIRCVLRPVLEILYRKEIEGLERLPASGGCLLACNHVSWIDGVLILWMLPRNVRFVVDGGNFHSRVLDYLAGAFDTIMMGTGPKAIGRAIRDAREGLHNGEVVGIFPEGTITRTGQLQAFKPGMAKILKGTEAVIVPMHLEGMWGSVFSFSGGCFFWKWPSQFRRKLTLSIGSPLPADTPPATVRAKVQSLGSFSATSRRGDFPVLARRAIRAWRRRGKRLQAADSTGVTVGGRSLLIRTLALRRALRREIFSADESFVGVLLPPSVGAVAVNVALAMDRRISANLNYTVTSEVMNHCIKDVGIRHVLTSQRFLDKIDVKLDAEVVLLESLKEKVTLVDKVLAAVQAVLLPEWLLAMWLGLSRVQPDDLLTVIFTSGSTGMPKGVLLSNANVSHNVDVVNRAVRLRQEDVIIGVLPFFHSFGYAVTLWATQTLGPAGVYHFNPLDSKQIGKLCEQYRGTVLLATPTFLRGYLRRVEPEQFATLDVVVVGAEKMPADLFDAFEQRFGVRPVEGYGTTEMSPLVSVNIPPSRSKTVHQVDRVEGSVGRPLPGISAKVISPDDGHELAEGEEGLLLVTGPNLMQGYANQSALTQKCVAEGWYTTGDIARIDEEGFLHITGRLSRFSKIAGEMVPHVRIEEELARLLDRGEDDEQVCVAVTAVPDEKKGERIIVLHRSTAIAVDQLREGLRTAGLPNLFVPSSDSFYEVDAIPILGSGKLDLKAVKELAARLTQGQPDEVTVDAG